MTLAYMVELVCSLYIYHLCEVHFGGSGFAMYSIFRRTLAWVLPVILLGMPIAIPYFLNQGKRNLSPALAIFLIASALLLLLFSLFPEKFALFFFSTKNGVPFVGALWVVVFGIGLSQIVLASQRAKIQYFQSFAFLLVVRVIIPFCVFKFYRNTLSETLLVLGCAWSLASLLWFAVTHLKNLRTFQRSDLSALLRYGSARTPGDLAWFGLLALPSIFISRENLSLAGRTGFSLSLLTVFGTFIEPIAYRLLPTASRLSRTRNPSLLTSEILRVTLWVTFLSMTAMVTGPWLLETAVTTLGFQKAYLVEDGRHLLWVLWPYGIFIAFRSILDGISSKPINTYLLLCVFTAYITMHLSFPRFGIWNFISAIYLLASLTICSLWRSLRSPSLRSATTTG